MHLTSCGTRNFLQEIDNTSIDFIKSVGFRTRSTTSSRASFRRRPDPVTNRVYQGGEWEVECPTAVAGDNYYPRDRRMRQGLKRVPSKVSTEPKLQSNPEQDITGLHLKALSISMSDF